MMSEICEEEAGVYLLNIISPTNTQAVQCCGCKFVPVTREDGQLEPDPVFYYRKFLAEHLRVHMYAGHNVTAEIFSTAGADWLKR